MLNTAPVPASDAATARLMQREKRAASKPPAACYIPPLSGYYVSAILLHASQREFRHTSGGADKVAIRPSAFPREISRRAVCALLSAIKAYMREYK